MDHRLPLHNRSRRSVSEPSHALKRQRERTRDSPETALRFNSTDADMIHDCALNYYGTLLATCSSDRTIKIFSVPATPGSTTAASNGSAAASSAPQAGQQQLLDTLTGHEGPVWQIAWAHPKFGNILASCSYDGKVFVWRQTNNNQGWQRIKEHTLHNASGAS